MLEDKALLFDLYMQMLDYEKYYEALQLWELINDKFMEFEPVG
jgi:hypothetical protein